MPRPISGRRFAPKIMMMMNRMITSSGKPRRPIMGTPSKFGAVPGDCITLAGRGRAAKTAAGWVVVAVGLTVAIAASGEARQFTSGVNLVEVYASVTDARGEPVTGLTQQDFEVRESGKLQQISNFAAGEVPLSVAVALDRSFSMSGRRLELAKVAAHDFLGELRPSDESMVIAIGSQVQIVAPLSA